MRTRYTIMGRDCNTQTGINAFVDNRTFKNLGYAKTKLRELDELTRFSVELWITEVSTINRCPHCKCDVGDMIEEVVEYKDLE